MDISKSTRVGLARLNKRQLWLAGELNVTTAYVSKVCKDNDYTPSTGMIESLALIFSVEVSEFIKWGEV